MSATLNLFQELSSDLIEYNGLLASAVLENAFDQYRFNPAAYISEILGWQAWQGDGDNPGQREILDAYVLALRQQHERQAFEAGEKTEAELDYWKPGQTIQNRIRIEAGHGTGKTKVASGIVSHFYDCFPSITYTFAPTWEQVKDLLWKEISTDRKGKNLPGRVLETCEIKSDSTSHFAKGRATNNQGGNGTERVHGQHHAYLLFILDEAEGVADFVYDAIDSMASGGIAIVIMLANPRTRTSRFHKLAAYSNVKSFRISCLYHPNVTNGREIIHGAVTRQYVLDMLEKHCEIADEHDADAQTFSLPWEPNLIYRPDAEFMFRVLGVAPSNLTDKCLVPLGRYEAACKRDPIEREPHKASMGVDCARWGLDNGTLYTCWNGRAWRNKSIGKLDQVEYFLVVKKEALALKARGVTHLSIRVDAGGGFGAGLIDLLKRDDELLKSFVSFQVLEVAFGGSAKDDKAFYDAITEMTADVAESLKSLAIINPPEALEADLCEREVEPRNKSGYFVKKLQEKDKFRRKFKRSPDDGDGFVLAVAGEHLFLGLPAEIIENPFY